MNLLRRMEVSTLPSILLSVGAGIVLGKEIRGIGGISRAMKAFAKELNVPVIVLSQ
jgi:replicative DNA helicase